METRPVGIALTSEPSLSWLQLSQKTSRVPRGSQCTDSRLFFMTYGLVSPEDGFCHENLLVKSQMKARHGGTRCNIEAGGPRFQDHPGLHVSIFRKNEPNRSMLLILCH